MPKRAPSPANLRKALARDLGLEQLPDKVWHYLEYDGRIRDYEGKPDNKEYQEVLDAARSRLRSKPGRKLGQRTTLAPRGLDLTESLHPLEEERARIRTDHLGRLAARTAVVQSTRERVLNGQVLDCDAVESFLRQIAPRHYSVEWFQSHGIPIVHHRSYLLDELPPAYIDPGRSRLRIEWDGGCEEIPDVSGMDFGAHDDGIQMKLPVARIQVDSESVFGELQHAATELAEFYNWEEVGALYFVLTGIPPWIPPIDVQWFEWQLLDHDRIIMKLEIEPWVSPSSVARAYRQLQNWLYARQLRPFGAKALALFEFVEEFRERVLDKGWDEIAHEGVDFPWHQVTHEWNEGCDGHEGWLYESSRLRRDFAKVADAIVYPGSWSAVEASKSRRNRRR